MLSLSPAHADVPIAVTAHILPGYAAFSAALAEFVDVVLLPGVAGNTRFLPETEVRQALFT